MGYNNRQMSTIEYKDGKGRMQKRDVVIGVYESGLRKIFLNSFLPEFKQLLVETVGETFSIKIVGSVAANTSTVDSDIDLYMEPRKSSTKYQKDILVVESLRVLQSLQANELPYRIDLWFENEFSNRNNPF